ncbi:MAG: hypothetical protein AB1437_24660 [Pseudomonadota bacterium]
MAIVRTAAAATERQLEAIYTLIERSSTLPAAGHVLARTNRRSTGSGCIIPIPQELTGFPWAGRRIEVTIAKEVEYRFIEPAPGEPSLLGKVVRPVRVPRHPGGRSGKARNAFAPEKYLAGCPELHAALEEVCPAYPAELLAYLLCIGGETFEFEPINQARIGTSAAWVQHPEHRNCGECGKRMALILQLPGTAISRKHLHEGTFYLFGCPQHPDQTSSVAQFG